MVSQTSFKCLYLISQNGGRFEVKIAHRFFHFFFLIFNQFLRTFGKKFLVRLEQQINCGSVFTLEGIRNIFNLLDNCFGGDAMRLVVSGLKSTTARGLAYGSLPLTRNNIGVENYSTLP